VENDFAPNNKGMDGVNLKGNIKKEGKTKWGPVLVEKRSSWNPRDGRTIMKKAQERKKLANLDAPNGTIKIANSFSILASVEISIVAKEIGISLGSAVEEIEESMREIQENDKIRSGLFEGQCDQCQTKDEVDNVESNGSKVLVCSEGGFLTPSTNDWINKWGLIEIDPINRKFTWSNNQKHPILAKIDRVFITTGWEASYPLVKVSCLPKCISDHTPLLLESGDNCSVGRKKFKFEKWWLQREDFGGSS
jgi:hypothetical protein